ncbi:MAG: threonylcarbamoyl-AMP synthase [Burkholderiales bacterium]|nr:threonylcarbamoyl-AMP synthase [Burkholderiales bacterium]
MRRAVEILRNGGLVAFPTETVYGLGADAADAEAVARLYAVKGRPKNHPVIVHFSSAEDAFEWAREVPQAARRLAAKYWPGPLTLVLKRSAKAGDFVTGGQDSVGLRVPSHPVARELLLEFGGGVAAPSANEFGNVSATTAQHVRGELGGKVDFVLEGGSSEVGIESTILDLSCGTPVLLRPGHVSRDALEEVLKEKVLEKEAGSPRHSGGLARHYAPKTPALLVPAHELDAEIARRGARVAVLAFSRPDERVDYWIRMPKDPQAYARRLYAALRELDGAGCETILIESPPETSPWTAVRDRLSRAAASPAR